MKQSNQVKAAMRGGRKAQPLRDQSGPADALALLGPVYDRFSEGFETADLESAKTLLDALGHAQ